MASLLASISLHLIATLNWLIPCIEKLLREDLKREERAVSLSDARRRSFILFARAFIATPCLSLSNCVCTCERLKSELNFHLLYAVSHATAKVVIRLAIWVMASILSGKRRKAAECDGALPAPSRLPFIYNCGTLRTCPFCNIFRILYKFIYKFAVCSSQ